MNNQKKRPCNSLKKQQKYYNCIQIVEYSKVNVCTTEKTKTAVKNNTGATSRMSLKMSDGNDRFHELLLTTRQRTNLRNAFNNNM